MKTIYKHLWFLIFIFILTESKAQTDPQYHVIVNHQSAPLACDGTIEIQCTNCPPGVNFTWADSAGVIIGTGNLMTGLCDDFYYIVPDLGCGSHYLFTAVHDVTVSGTGMDAYFSFHADTNLNCLGAVQASFTGVTLPLVFDFENYDSGMIIEYVDTLSSISGRLADSLCADTSYIIGVMDSLYNYIYFRYKPMVFTSANCSGMGSGQLWLESQGMPVSDSSLCDGTAYAVAYGGTPPYSYQFSSGSVTTNEINLCPGSYVVTVTDNNSDSYSSTFIIGYPGTYFFNDPGSLTYLDTLYTDALQNCGIDYSLPLDTFYIDTMYNISPYTYVGEWIIVQDSVDYLFSETYYVPDSTQNFMFGLSVFCSMRSFDFGSFSLFVGMPGVSNGINEINENQFSATLIPNPLENIATLSFKSAKGNYLLTVVDITGRTVYHSYYLSSGGKNNLLLDLSLLTNGYYVFSLTNESGMKQTIPFIKTGIR